MSLRRELELLQKFKEILTKYEKNYKLKYFSKIVLEIKLKIYYIQHVVGQSVMKKTQLLKILIYATNSITN